MLPRNLTHEINAFAKFTGGLLPESDAKGVQEVAQRVAQADSYSQAADALRLLLSEMEAYDRATIGYLINSKRSGYIIATDLLKDHVVFAHTSRFIPDDVRKLLVTLEAKLVSLRGRLEHKH